METAMRLVGYRRVSTQEQAESGLGLDAQKMTIQMAAALRGAEVVAWLADEGLSGAKADRPGLLSALELVKSGEADGIIVAKLDRLSRSAIQAMQLIRRANDEGWALICIDLGLDTSTPVGKFVAGVMASMAELERDLISERTKAAMAAKKERGEPVGRPRQIPEYTRQRMIELRQGGMGWSTIAWTLAAENHRPPQGRGKTWATSTIRKVCS